MEAVAIVRPVAVVRAIVGVGIRVAVIGVGIRVAIVGVRVGEAIDVGAVAVIPGFGRASGRRCEAHAQDRHGCVLCSVQHGLTSCGTNIRSPLR